MSVSKGFSLKSLLMSRENQQSSTARSKRIRHRPKTTIFFVSLRPIGLRWRCRTTAKMQTNLAKALMNHSKFIIPDRGSLSIGLRDMPPNIQFQLNTTQQMTKDVARTVSKYQRLRCSVAGRFLPPCVASRGFKTTSYVRVTPKPGSAPFMLSPPRYHRG
jgi:hypothetical protein